MGGSEATLLAKLGIKPFSYGLVVQQARCPSGSMGALRLYLAAAEV